MTRSLAALACFTAALLGAPSKSDAGPWMYDDSFYGPSWGSGYGWGGSYGTYTAGYAPFYAGYTASYAPAYAGGACCGTTTGYSYGGACCSPCGTSSCNPCGTGCGTGCGTSCDPGCGNNCPGGNCATGSGSAPVQSTPSDTGSGNPTYAPATNAPEREAPADQFGPARTAPAPRNRDGLGTAAPAPGGFNPPATGGPPVDPNSSAPAPDFAPAQPQQPGHFDRKKDDQSRENGSVTPKVSPIEPGDKVAFKTPARFSRTNLQPVFELPTIVKAPPSIRPEAAPIPTAVASK